MKFKSINSAFTLAEVLIVLAIIGVASVLTIPLIADSFAEHRDLLTLKKDFNLFATAAQNMISEEGVNLYYIISADRSSSSDYILKSMANSLKVTMHCDTSSLEKCYAGDPIYDTGNTKLDNNIISYMQSKKASAVVLPDDSIITVYNCTAPINGYARCMVMIDINGSEKGPNRYSYDLFEFILGLNGNLGFDGATAFETPVVSDASVFVKRGQYSSSDYTEWALTFNNMDYKRCASSLNWKTKHSCND